MKIERVKTKNNLDWRSVKLLMEREDSNGKPIPFSICYVCQNGSVVDTGEEKCVICIGVDNIRHVHTIKSIATEGYIRKVRDVMILRIDDTKIIVS